MGCDENRSARRFIHAARFHTDEAILDQIELTYSVFAAESVQLLNQLYAVYLFAVKFCRHAFIKTNLDVIRLVRGFRDRPGDDKQIIFRLIGGVFKVSPFMADVPEVAVARVDFLLALVDGDFVFFCIIDRRFPAGQREVRVFPRSYNFQDGSRAIYVSSKRTWSLPLPVAPWATAVAPSA